MTDVTPYRAIPAEVAPAQLDRPRLLMVGTALGSAAIAMGFLALIAVYIAERAAVIAADEIWLPDGVVIPLTQPNFIGLTLIFSVISVWWSLASVKNEDNANAYAAFALTLLFGFAALAQTAYLLSLMELEIASTERAVYIYAVIGTHMFLLMMAMAYLAIMGLRTLGGEYRGRAHEGVLSSALFWTVVVALYGVMWFAIYITK